jgi:hypothetical protein
VSSKTAEGLLGALKGKPTVEVEEEAPESMGEGKEDEGDEPDDAQLEAMQAFTEALKGDDAAATFRALHAVCASMGMKMEM